MSVQFKVRLVAVLPRVKTLEHIRLKGGRTQNMLTFWGRENFIFMGNISAYNERHVFVRRVL